MLGIDVGEIRKMFGTCVVLGMFMKAGELEVKGVRNGGEGKKTKSIKDSAANIEFQTAKCKTFHTIFPKPES